MSNKSHINNNSNFTENVLIKYFLIDTFECVVLSLTSTSDLVFLPLLLTGKWSLILDCICLLQTNIIYYILQTTHTHNSVRHRPLLLTQQIYKELKKKLHT